MNYIVFDLEATCWDTFPEKNHNFNEIIEIGAVKLDDDLNEISRFDTFVRPVIHTKLSPFCLNLTSIKQDQVDSAPVFSEALQLFHKWVVEGTDHEPASSYTLLSWGEYDRKQLLKEMERKIQSLNAVEYWNWKGFRGLLEERHVSLKHRYVDQFQIKKGAGVSATLKRLGLLFEGTQHRGIDDSINIAKIFREVRSDLGL